MNRERQPAAEQPLGFWTARAGEAVRARTRARLDAIGVTQPEWWVLHYVSLHPAGIEPGDVTTTLGHNESEAAIDDAIDSGVGKGWIDRQAGRLQLTPAGHDRFRIAEQVQSELNAERRQGISDAEYVTTIEVLQRTIANVGGDAWHW